WTWPRLNKSIYAKLAYRELRVPPQRYVVHNGYRAQSIPSSGGYYSALQELPVDVIPATPGATRRRAAFLVNRYSRIPDAALALQGTGDAVIIAHGTSTFEELTTSTSIPIGEKHRLLVRITEFEPIGPVAPHVDAELPADAGDDAVIKAALAQLAKPLAKGKP